MIVEHPFHNVLNVTARRMTNTQVDVVFSYLIVCHRTALQQQQQRLAAISSWQRKYSGLAAFELSSGSNFYHGPLFRAESFGWPWHVCTVLTVNNFAKLLFIVRVLANHATGYASQHIWWLPQARIKWEGCGRKCIRHKNGGDDGGGPLISLDGMAPIWMVGVSASVTFLAP